MFFAWCNLRCVFCQNFDLSQQGAGREVRPDELARMMLALQAKGCHNINLVMPGGVAGTREIMRFLATKLSLDTYVNIMAQYYPANKVSAESYLEINRMVTPREVEEAVRIAREQGLYRFDMQDPWQN